MRIADLPISERPREKALQKGLAGLSDAELLALLIGQGVKGDSALEIANRLLASYSSLYAMTNASVQLLSETRGISTKKALLLSAAFEIGKRVASFRKEERYYVPREVAARYMAIYKGSSNESLYLLVYGNKGRLLLEKEIAIGGIKGVESDEGTVLSSVLGVKGKGFILVHNHPSGEAYPSVEDRTFTLSLAHTASRLGLRLLDHLIIGEEEYYSFLEHRESQP